MNPAPPAPTPGTSSVANQLQTIFDTAYYASKHPAMQPLYWGRPGVPTPAGEFGLTQDQMWTLGATLIQQGHLVDEEIDLQGWDPYTIMWQREFIYGNTWEPAGMGKTQSTEVLTPGQFTGAVPPGAIPVTLDLAAYPPYPVQPVGPPVPPPMPKLANPVGVLRIQFGAKPAVGDMYARVVDSTGNDGWVIGDTFSGMAQGITGSWQKQSVFMGMTIYWVRTA